MSKKDAGMTSSDFNLQKLNTGDLAEHISASIAIDSNIAIFGRRGSGKTEIAKQQIAKAKCREVYVNLSVLERVDMGGYPDLMSPTDKQRKFVEFLLPKFYEPMLEGTEGVVALLDEVDKADSSLWAPLLEFTQFKSINGRKLPNLRSVIMTGNLIRPSPPLLDRTEKYLIEADVEAWLEWSGRVGGIHPAILAYIKDNPQDLFGNVDPEDRYADPSPRGWARASQIVRGGEKLNWSVEVLNRKVSGCVGKSAGVKYSNYYEHYQVLLPLVDAIFDGKNQEPLIKEYSGLNPTKQLVACMITCNRLALQLDASKKSDPPASLVHVGKFLQHVSLENILVAVRSNIQLDRIVKWNLDDHPDWQPLLSKVNNRVRGKK
jgi:hypothetical protein